MTRKQAEKVADEIVKLARASQSDPAWTRAEFRISDELRAKIDEDGPLIVGVMPIGWRLAGIRGLETLCVVRSV